jgi:hypothetical protein
MGDSGRSRAEFLLLDLDLANTFLDIAGTTNQAAVRERNIANAWRAHDVVADLTSCVSLTSSEVLAITERLHALRIRLSNIDDQNSR